jgi:lysozyme
VFNLGPGALAVSTLLTLLNEGRDAEAAEQFARWDHVGQIVVPGLLTRRLAEAKLFSTPEVA